MKTLELDSVIDSALDFDEFLRQVHVVGKTVLAVHAAEVDRDARFPKEAFAALRQAKLLSAYVPTDFGGMGLNIVQIGRICEALGQYCGSSAMIYAMHCIQVVCVVHHAQESSYYRDYLWELVADQRLMASATTEIGTGGDLRSSVCAIEVSGHDFKLTKKAPVISYGETADDILVTCRRSPDAPASDQVQVLVRRGEFTTEPLSNWDTMGFRRRLGYFHGQGYYELHGDDFVNIFNLDGVKHPAVLPPYAEFVKRRSSAALAGDELVQVSLKLLRRQLPLLPEANPFAKFKPRFEADLQWLASEPIETFHQYSFATLRQFGSCYEVAATYLRWLQSHGVSPLERPIAAFTELSTGAKTMQFQLARATARKKPMDLSILDQMATTWESATEELKARFA